jgi:hypothetical protein
MTASFGLSPRSGLLAFGHPGLRFRASLNEEAARKARQHIMEVHFSWNASHVRQAQCRLHFRRS